VAYGLLTTPDRVQSIVLPTDGLIAIGFNAEWKESVAAASRAAIFIGATQLKVWNQTVAAPLQAASEVGADVYAPLASCSLGLVGFAISGVSGVATGQIVGGFGDTTIAAHLEVGGTVEQIASRMPIAGLCYVFAAAGTYDVSVQFKSSSGSVTVKNRKLWVQATGF